MNSNNDEREIADLKQRLHDAAEAYYQGHEDSGMTDDEYDAAVKYLKKLTAGSHDSEAEAIVDGQVAAGTKPEGNTVHHDVPMLSLAKADSEDQVRDYVRRMIDDGATGFRLQAKLDGLACSAVYKDGSLTMMSTRGNGADGEDISYLINNDKVRVEGMPNHLTGPVANADIEVRGELLLRTSEFDRLNSERRQSGLDEYRNPRNTNAGIVKRAMKGEGENASLQFVMYKIVGNESEDDLAAGGLADINGMTASEWTKTGHDMPQSLTVTCGNRSEDEIVDEVMTIIDMFGPVRDDLDLPTDGIVIKPVNEQQMDEKLGHNAHHPLSQLAWKYPGAKAQVRITGVEWSVGKSGRLTPRLDYEPTWFGGSENTHATLHNPAILKELGIKIGSVVEVEKRHDVIPQVIRERPIYTPDEGDVLTTPEHCPYCGSTIRNDDRMSYCPNKHCPSRGAYMLNAAASKGGLDFDGAGGALIDALQESGMVNDVADFYDLTVDDLANTKVGVNGDGSSKLFGMTRAKHVMSYIEKSKTLPYHRVLASLSIQDLGGQTAKAIIKSFPDIDDLKNATPEELSTVEGVGALTAQRIIEGVNVMWPIITRLRAHGLQFHEDTDDRKTATEADSRIAGKKFSISGQVPEGWSNRGEWQDWIESKGGTAQSAPTADTDIMVGDANGHSSKLVKARKYGVRIISPEQFIAEFVG